VGAWLAAAAHDRFRRAPPEVHLTRQIADAGRAFQERQSHELNRESREDAAKKLAKFTKAVRFVFFVSGVSRAFVVDPRSR
jgi:hypothetical protein